MGPTVDVYGKARAFEGGSDDFGGVVEVDVVD